MKMIKTVLMTTGLIGTFAFSTVHGNGFFDADADPVENYQPQPESFNESIHEGTTFWGYFNNGMPKHTSIMNKKVVTFDESKHIDTGYWDFYYSL